MLDLGWLLAQGLHTMRVSKVEVPYQIITLFIIASPSLRRMLFLNAMKNPDPRSRDVSLRST